MPGGAGFARRRMSGRPITWRDVRRASSLASRDGTSIALYGDAQGFTGVTVTVVAASHQDQPDASAAAPATSAAARSSYELEAAQQAGEQLTRAERKQLRSALRAKENNKKKAEAAAAPAAATSPAEAPAAAVAHAPSVGVSAMDVEAHTSAGATKRDQARRRR